jgi:hypothetical protein
LFSIKRSYVILSIERWRKVSLFPSGSNHSQPPVFPDLDVAQLHRASWKSRPPVRIEKNRPRSTAIEI